MYWTNKALPQFAGRLRHAKPAAVGVAVISVIATMCVPGIASADPFVSAGSGNLSYKITNGSSADVKLAITAGSNGTLILEDPDTPFSGSNGGAMIGCSYTNPANHHRISCSSTNGTFSKIDIQTVRGNDTVDITAVVPANVNSGSGNDIVRTSNASGDVLFGGIGNDTLDGAAGNDSLDGYEGTDMVDYSRRPNRVVANLAAGSGGVGIEQDTYSGVEIVSGGSGGDVLLGDAQPNVLIGNGGADAIIGNEGEDWLVGGDGNDTIHSRDPVPGAFLFWPDTVHCGPGTDTTISNPTQTWADTLHDCELDGLLDPPPVPLG